jgi:uncharacterized membrane protein HdeD (DUF308 family)
VYFQSQITCSSKHKGNRLSLVIVRNWWSLAICGLIAVLLGIITFVWPASGSGLLFGVYALIDGVVSIIGAVRASAAHERWGALLLEGVAGLVAGCATLFWPAITVIALTAVIAVWAIITRIFEISAAWRLRKHISGEWLLASGGAAPVIFGVFVLMIAPLAGALVLALWLGAYALVFGVLMIALGFRLRSRVLHFGDAAVMGSPNPASYKERLSKWVRGETDFLRSSVQWQSAGIGGRAGSPSNQLHSQRLCTQHPDWS